MAEAKSTYSKSSSERKLLPQQEKKTVAVEVKQGSIFDIQLPDYQKSDVDDFINELLRIKPKCLNEGFHLIISNICFEVWLYYAYHDVIPHFTLPNDPLKISGKFKGWLPSVITGGVKPQKAILNIYANIENAKKNYNEDENEIPVMFSTNMFILAKELLPLIEPELTNMIEDNKRVEAKFRNKKKK